MKRAPDVLRTVSASPGSEVEATEAEETLRAISAGEVDAFVVSDGDRGQRVFTLSTADRPYRIFVDNMRDGAATLSTDGIVLYANERLAGLVSSPRESIVGSPLTKFLMSNEPLGQDEMGGERGLGATFELDLRDAHGMAVPVLVGTSPLEIDGGVLTCLTFTDLSAQKAQSREIARLADAQMRRLADLQDAQAALTVQATHDALTGLPNRALIVDRIEHSLAHARRSGDRVAVLFVDLDRFKHVNDTIGHAAGDTVLQQVAAQLIGALRPMDTVARIGGDEFAVLADVVDSSMHAVDIGDRLVAELSRPRGRFEVGGSISASVGISVSLRGAGTAESMLHEADTAMYQAKSRGGGRAEVFDVALGRMVQEQSRARRMLQRALDDRRVIAYYQPILDVGSGTVSGFEALARIVHLNGSILPPATFITVAEESGLVVRLGAQVLSMACLEAGSWSPPLGSTSGPLTVAVNLSSRQLGRPDLMTSIRRSLDEAGLDPSCLHLELTETAIIDLRPEVLEQLRQMRELGIEVGLDDFGTGYASLTHLRRLPLSFVKIDRSFVQRLETDNDDERIVAAVVDLAANLGLRSIAEGVETTGQLARLRELGCDQAQGYLFARPLPADEVAAAIVRPAW